MNLYSRRERESDFRQLGRTTLLQRLRFVTWLLVPEDFPAAGLLILHTVLTSSAAETFDMQKIWTIHLMWDKAPFLERS